MPAYGDLTGLRGLRPGADSSSCPTRWARALADAPASRMPETDRVDMKAGLDARYRVTSNLTLTATANPDFGQVEVDPAVINLSAFETRFQEKRPFFVEGQQFPVWRRRGWSERGGASVLYSRRLGRAPQLSLGAERDDPPDTATILGAVKLTGKTSSGWNVGVLEALTGAEHGRFPTRRLDQRALVEPQTNYFVGRVNRDLRRGQSNIGGIFTAANRDLAGPAAGGVCVRGVHGRPGLRARVGESKLGRFRIPRGQPRRRQRGGHLATQRSSTRYYQRPDASGVASTRRATSLNGAAASVHMRKTAGLHWTTDSWLQRSRRATRSTTSASCSAPIGAPSGRAITYSQRQPGKVLRDWRSTTYINHAQNFDGD